MSPRLRHYWVWNADHSDEQDAAEYLEDSAVAAAEAFVSETWRRGDPPTVRVLVRFIDIEGGAPADALLPVEVQVRVRMVPEFDARLTERRSSAQQPGGSP